MCIRDRCDDLLDGSPEGFILASLRPKDRLFHHRDIDHMEVVVVHILAQSFGHCPVALIGVHHSGEDILLTTHNLHGGFIGIGIKLFCKLIAAVVIEVRGVDVEDQLSEFLSVCFQTAGGDHAGRAQLLDVYKRQPLSCSERLISGMTEDCRLYSETI